MTRHLIYIFRHSWLSLLAIGLTITFWIRSYHFNESANLYLTNGMIQSIGSRNGELRMLFSRIEVGADWAWTAHFTSSRDADLQVTFGENVASRTDPVKSKKGFGLWIGGHDPADALASSAMVLSMPHWIFLALAIVQPIRQGRKFLVLSKRTRMNLCLSCGYDLRSSPDRCPECGEEAPTSTSV